jgi:type II secretory pathway pseudopilin PulG
MDLPPPQQKLNNASGVTAIELLIVVAMVGVIVGFVVINLGDGNRTSYRQGATLDFAIYLQKARLDSMQRQVKDINQMAQVKVFNRRFYSIAIDADGDGQLDIPLVMNLTSEQDVEINGPFPKTFIFDALGQPVDSSSRRIAPQPITFSNSSGASAVKFSETGEAIVVPAVKLTGS